ncbi:ATP-binding cassette domain-containing protein [Vibrio cincinnatiensis]|uniref:ATP-binding cassette domain-containing protein n=1 Tax=Vibrio cincinnatiensis TaxID=675 RepID=UPI001EDD2103|nr:ATP-binding cassette domain-containing protein [Vibrio cincinnatiensis]
MSLANEQHVVLDAKGISKFFPGVKALQDVDFSLNKGEIMALLGENGAGKSTLVKTLTGVYQRDEGSIYLEGQLISPQSTAHAQKLGIGTVYQEVNLLSNMSVMDNLFIGNEPRKWGLVDRRTMAQQAQKM